MVDRQPEPNARDVFAAGFNLVIEILMVDRKQTQRQNQHPHYVSIS